MTALTVRSPRLRTLLLPLLLAACTGKEGVLTEASASTDGPATDSAGTTTAAATDGETGPLLTTDEPATEGTTGPHPNTSNATDSTTTPFPETSATTGIDVDVTGPETTTIMGSTGDDTTTGNGTIGVAALYNDCAPNDGPAFRVEIGVSEPTCGAAWEATDKLTIHIYKMAPVAPGEFKLGFPDDGDAILDTGDGSPNVATAGTLTIDSWTDDQVTGSYDLTLDDNTHLAGDFAGPYCGGPFLCG